jgi:hypothetical protein
MTYHQVCDKNNTTSATRGAVTATYTGASECTTSYSRVRVARSLKEQPGARLGIAGFVLLDLYRSSRVHD